MNRRLQRAVALGVLLGWALVAHAQVIVADRYRVSVPRRDAKFWWGTDTRNGAGVVLMDEKVLFEIRRPAGGYNTSERAEIVAGRLERMYPRMQPEALHAGKLNSEIVVLSDLSRSGDYSAPRDSDLIVTVDNRTAADLGKSRWLLAHWWRDLFRDYMLVDRGQTPRYVAPAEPLMGDYSRAKKAHAGDEGKATAALGARAKDRLRRLYEAPAPAYQPAAPDIPR